MVRYLDLVEGKSGPGPLSAGDGKVPDGVRYHVLDVWVDGLVECEGWDETVVMRPVERLWRQGRTKIVRGRARDVLDDERLKAEGNGAVENEERNDYDVGEDGDWEGFAD